MSNTKPISPMTIFHENFLLENRHAEALYHEYAKDLPIIDYHNHLIPEQIAENKRFDNITQAWLYGDHYKWRAMRAWGVDEKYVTGEASDEEKFRKWAEVVPHTLRNPLFHWTHLELKRYFGIDEYLNEASAERIYNSVKEQFSSGEKNVRQLLTDRKVEVVCTTDDPLDDLAHHQAVKASGFAVKVLPTFRPDKAMDATDSQKLKAYYERLSQVSGVAVNSFEKFLEAMQARHDFFHQQGCRLSDHGLSHIFSEAYTANDIKAAFAKIMAGEELSQEERRKYQSACLLEFARMDHAKGWAQQFHLGALRNNNARMLREIGPDTGFDSIGDFPQAEAMSRLFNALEDTGQLAKTIVYNLNPAQNEVFATMMGNYNDGSVRGKMQFGSGWWFLDQLDGMEKQMNALSNMGLLSAFVGMLTDSRSFLSFPRHEYFRRLLCNMLGQDIEKGLIPHDIPFIGQMVQNVSYRNAKSYFGF